MLPEKALLDDAARLVRGRLGPADVGVVLGSGLGAFAHVLQDSRSLPYAEIPGMPVSTVAGHAGRLHVGKIDGVAVACLQGRVHAYEGHPLQDVCFGVCLLTALGCSTVLLSNAAGGIDQSFGPGTLMLIEDHINLTGRSPLIGPTPWAGPRFLDMSHAYDQGLAQAALRLAQAQGIPLARGVYAGLLGPSYETPSEIRMLRTLGASAVGMSTVLEVLALRQLGTRVGAISCITNLAAGMGTGPLDHTEVQAAADEAAERFERLMTAWCTASASI